MSSGRIIKEAGIEYKIAKILLHYGLTVTTAESCTGGLAAGALVNAEGISAAFKEGFITYSNEAKMKYLGVSKETLDQHGAVSRETAIEMAEGAAKAAQADAAIAITGIAGPGGGSPEKPVGLVYIACSFRGKTVVKRCHYGGDRDKVRLSATKEALEILYCQLLNYAQ